jgi:hypothetical protein
MSPAPLPAFGSRRPPQDPHHLAKMILAEPRFRVHVAPVRTDPWGRLLAWLQARWHDLTTAFGQHVHVGPQAQVAAGDILLALALLAVVVMAVRLGAQYLRDFTVPAPYRRLLEPRLAARALYQRSLHAAEEGRCAEAIALIFNAALTLLDVRGLVHDDPSRTVNECRGDVLRSAPACAPPFDRIAHAFTAAAFSRTGASVESWSAARSAYEELVSLAPAEQHAA